MIQYIEHKDIDREKWDRCILSNSLNPLYGLSWYLDIVSPHWHGLISDNYNHVLPLPRKKKAGISYLIQPPYTQQLGVFTSQGICQPEMIARFLDSIPRKYKLIKIALNENNPVPKGEFQFKKRVNYLLHLKADYSLLKSDYSENIKRNIKKAIKNQIFIKEVQDYNTLLHLKRNNPVANLQPIHYQIMENLMHETMQNKSGNIYMAYDKNKSPLGGVFLPRLNKRMIYLISVSNNTGKNSGAMALLIDTIIKQNAGNQEILDFEGSSIPGLARFFSGFGAKPVYFHEYHQNRLPFPLNFFHKIK